MERIEIEKNAIEKTLSIASKLDGKTNDEAFVLCEEKIMNVVKVLEDKQKKLFGDDFIAMTSFFELCEKHFPDKYKELTPAQKTYLGIMAVSICAGKMADMVLNLNNIAEQMKTQQQINNIAQKIINK